MKPTRIVRIAANKISAKGKRKATIYVCDNGKEYHGQKKLGEAIGLSQNTIHNRLKRYKWNDKRVLGPKKHDGSASAPEERYCVICDEVFVVPKNYPKISCRRQECEKATFIRGHQGVLRTHSDYEGLSDIEPPQEYTDMILSRSFADVLNDFERDTYRQYKEVQDEDHTARNN